MLDLQAGTLTDQPRITRVRYLNPVAPADVPVTIASPASGTTVTGAETVVTGTTTPGARVDVAAGQPASPANTTTVVATVADSHGAYAASIPTPSGTTIITAAATVGAHATGWIQESVMG